MPLVLNPNNATDIAALEQQKYDYKYPMGLNLRPGSELHEKLKEAVLTRARMSNSAMSGRFESWREIDKTLTAYIPLSEAEEKVLAKDSRKPVSTVVPVSYATLETLLTYLVAAFLDEPIFRYEGVGPEDVLGSALLEHVVSLQSARAKMGVQLHTMFRDALAYGFGAVTPVWMRKYGFRDVMKRESYYSTVSGEEIQFEPTRERTEHIRYEGNELYNIDPYNYLPDPSVSISDIQRGEFVGWVARENRMSLLKQEYAGGIFNAKYIEHISGKSFLSTDQSRRDRYKVGGDNKAPDVTKPVDVIHMYIDLIPSEWNLGRNNYPETWVFSLAGDQVLVRVGPTELNHGLKPAAVCAPEYDGHTVSPISKLEVINGLQRMMDFLYNSHMLNIRKAVHDMFVADPSMVNLNDIVNPSAGRIIRLRKRAWGKGTQSALEQLKVTDITRAHMQDALVVADMVQRIAGTPDTLQGFMRPSSERRSATEAHEARSGALSRIEKAARVASLQAMQDLGYMLAIQTQQFMTREQYIKIGGRYEEELRKEFGDVNRTLVGPFDILVDFDVKMHDGTLPTSGDPGLWATMFQVIASRPELAQQFDVARIFKYWARLSGAKNVNDFVIKAQVRPDEEVMNEVEKGNLVSLEEALVQ